MPWSCCALTCVRKIQMRVILNVHAGRRFPHTSALKHVASGPTPAGGTTSVTGAGNLRLRKQTFSLLTARSLHAATKSIVSFAEFQQHLLCVKSWRKFFPLTSQSSATGNVSGSWSYFKISDWLWNIFEILDSIEKKVLKHNRLGNCSFLVMYFATHTQTNKTQTNITNFTTVEIFAGVCCCN